ncbi:carmil, putative [Entamoeba dispar SAW760]|uniref:Carmil, putative n=1 Tax=Entamoeba dispar (strain ATCC PRA-260 / SAW760) TaxID=370354 RepID=B0ESA7_ENTDS|nr:carmil, putative [Entamoeba dispar SAW760]EDR22592.1 carmil, putative [Entamoeba dispar SAW760]|eukprot:EDR22592.1 carmil, putative [Entamoeba dispar SAW760]
MAESKRISISESFSVDFNGISASEITSDASYIPNHYNVIRSQFKTIPQCPLQPPPDLKTYREIREKKTGRSIGTDKAGSSLFSGSMISDITNVTANSVQMQEKMESMQIEFPLEFNGKSHSPKVDEKYLIYSQRELEDLKRIVLLMLDHCPQTFNLLFDSKTASSTSRGILAMTASTQTTINFIQKIMNLEFEENAGTDKLMRENCPTNLLCKSLFEAIVPEVFVDKVKEFFTEFINLKSSFEIDDLFVENDDEIESNFELLQSWTEKYIKIVTDFFPSLPLTIFQICNVYRELVIKHLPTLPKGEADVMTVTFLTQNCFMSIIENPEKFHIKGLKKSSHIVERNFTILTNVLKTLFAGKKFSNKRHGYMAPLNPFIDSSFSRLRVAALKNLKASSLTITTLKESQLMDARAISSVHREFSEKANTLMNGFQGHLRLLFLENMLDLGSYERKCNHLNAFDLEQVKLFRKEITKQKLDCYFIMKGTVICEKKKDKNDVILYDKIDKKNATVCACFITEDFLTFVDLKGNTFVKRVFNRQINSIQVIEGAEQHITIDAVKQTLFINGDNNNLFIVYLMRAFAHGYYRKPTFSLKAPYVVTTRILPYPLNYKSQSGGFLGVYKANCASFGVKMNNGLVFDIANDIRLQTPGEERTLDLSKYYNDDYNNTKEDCLLDTDMQPIFCSITHNHFFKKIVIQDTNLRRCYSQLKDILATNTTIESLALINVSLGSKWADVFEGYNYNPKHPLLELDVSSNQMDSKGIAAIGAVIRCYRLESINLANVLTHSSTVSAFLDDLRKIKTSIPLRSLNISGAQMYYTQTEFLVSLINGMLPSLTELIMKDCEVPKETSLIKCVCALKKVVKLDITGLNFNQELIQHCVDNLGSKLDQITNLSLEKAVIDKTTLRKFIEEIPAKSVSLDLSESSLTTEIMTSFSHMFAGLTSIKTINVSYTDIGDEGIISLCEALTQNTVVEELNISGSFGRTTKKQSDTSTEVVKAICNLLVSGCPLKILRMAGGKKESQKLGINIVPIFDTLVSQNQLEVLDVSGHNFGNKGAFSLSNMIRSNSKLNELNWDENNVGVSGMRSVALKLKHNITLLNFQIPVMDCGSLTGRDLLEARNIINDMLISSN